MHCDAARVLVDLAADCADKGCGWCLLRLSATDTDPGAGTSSLSAWAQFFDTHATGWRFREQQHDVAEALRVLLNDAENRSPSHLPLALDKPTRWFGGKVGTRNVDRGPVDAQVQT